MNTTPFPNPRTSAYERLIAFRMDGQTYALALSAVEEVLYAAHMPRPAACPALLAGILEIGSQAVPCISLRRLFGLPEKPIGLYTPLLVLKGRSRLVLMVDALEGTIVVDPSATESQVEQCMLNGCLSHVLQWSGKNVFILSADRLFLAEEAQRLVELSEMRDSRLALNLEVAS